MIRKFLSGAALLVAILFGLMWWEHRTPMELPKPTGPYAVGRASFLATNPATRRDVFIWEWYPAQGSGPRHEHYLPEAWKVALAKRSGVLMSQILTRDPDAVKIHSDGMALPAPGRFPIVLLRAGGSALVADFTTLAEDLASHGYYVAGFDAPYRSSTFVYPDGRVVNRAAEFSLEEAAAGEAEKLAQRMLPLWVEDERFVLDWLKMRGGFTDFDRVGAFGHSFGGATSLEFCREDDRCKAGIDLDGDPFGPVVQSGLKQPFLFLLSDHGDLTKGEARGVIAKIRGIVNRLPGQRPLLMITKTNHFSFSDQILLKSQYLVATMQRLRSGPSGRRGLQITTDYVHTFFDVYLKGTPVDEFEKLRAKYPEVRPLP